MTLAQTLILVVFFIIMVTISSRCILEEQKHRWKMMGILGIFLTITIISMLILFIMEGNREQKGIKTIYEPVTEQFYRLKDTTVKQ